MLHTTICTPEQNLHPERAVLIPGHVGSAGADDMGHKARLMADHLGMEVVTWDRPGMLSNAGLVHDRPLSMGRYIEGIKQTGNDLSELLAARGIKRAISSGNSAAAPDAIHLSLAIAAVDVVAIGDPTALKDQHLIPGFGAWLRHRWTEHRRPAEKRNDEPGPSVPPLEMLRRFTDDIGIYRQIWCSSVALDGLHALARSPRISTTVEFVERTFAGTPDELTAIAKDLMTVRSELDPAAESAPFNAYVARGEYHSRYDNARIHANLIHRAMELADAS